MPKNKTPMVRKGDTITGTLTLSRMGPATLFTIPRADAKLFRKRKYWATFLELE